MRKFLIIITVVAMMYVFSINTMGAIKLGVGGNMGNFDGESYTDLQLEGQYTAENFKLGININDGILKSNDVYNPLPTITHKNIYGSYKLLSGNTYDFYAGVSYLNTEVDEELIFNGTLVTGEASFKVSQQMTFNAMFGFSLSGNYRIESLSLEDDASIFTFGIEMNTSFNESFSGRVGYRNTNYGLDGVDIGDNSLYGALSWGF